MPGMFCSLGSAQPRYVFPWCWFLRVLLLQWGSPRLWSRHAGRFGIGVGDAPQPLRGSEERRQHCSAWEAPGLIVEGIRSKNPSGYPFYFLS